MSTLHNVSNSLCYQGGLQDDEVTFHMRRSQKNYLDEQRQVVFFKHHHRFLTVTPGVHKRKENSLLKELSLYQSRKNIEQSAFFLDKLMFSYLWRFEKKEEYVNKKISRFHPLDPQVSRNALKIYKKYIDSLSSGLAIGNIYLIPDTEITFQNPRRYRQPYARRVLIGEIKSNQVWIIPFSTRVDKLNRSWDIVFDPSAGSSNLNTQAQPAVDNFPYKKMTRKSILCIQAAQPMTRDHFLGVALTSIGAIQHKTLEVVCARLKK